MNFGPQTSEPDSFAIMDRALELGINFFDTANVYGWKLGEGVTEQIIGRWFAQGGGRRDKVVLATKVYGKMGDWPNQRAVGPAHHPRLRGLAARLQTDAIDLYQMHHVSRTTPWEEIWQAMETLVRRARCATSGRPTSPAGTSRRPGVGPPPALPRSRLRAVHLQPAHPARRAGGHAGRAGVRHRDHPVVAAARRAALGRAAQAGRRHGGRTTSGARPTRWRSTAALEGSRSCAPRWARNRPTWRWRWLLARPGVTAPIVGPRTMEQLDGALRAVELTLSEETLTKLDELFPPIGDGGPGPEPGPGTPRRKGPLLTDIR
jgi:NDP-hexose 2,3-enoyl reductase